MDSNTSEELPASPPLAAPDAESTSPPPTSTDLPPFIPPSVSVSSLFSGLTYTYFSPIPPILLTNPSTPIMLGIDEAGRGPVLGPMVYAAAYSLSSYGPTVTEQGYADSKKMTPATRLNLLRNLCDASHPSGAHESLGWATTLLSPGTISTGMLRPATHGAYNLNALAHDTTIALIQGVIDRGVNVKEIYVDTVGIAATYQAKLAKIFPQCTVVVTKQADSIYPIVSAASVCAKVTRDIALEMLTEAGEVMGSGYPGDAKTIGYLKEHMDPVFGWRGEVVRFSWATARDMLEKDPRSAKVEWAEAMEDGDQNIAGFFSAEKDTGVGSWYGSTVGLSDF